MQATGAAAVIIGNEVLSAKVQEQNGALLIRRLRERGIPLRWLAMVPDEVDAIVEAVALARAKASLVLTSGGIGPTHDDATVRAVALALGRRVVRLPEMEALITQRLGPAASPEVFRLADAPEGAELLPQPGSWYLILACQGVYLLPGVPQLFRAQLETVLARFQGMPVCLRSLYLSAGEPEIAALLDRVAVALPSVVIGSYPQWDATLDFRVRVTVEHADQALVDTAVEQIIRGLPADWIVRTE